MGYIPSMREGAHRKWASQTLYFVDPSRMPGSAKQHRRIGKEGASTAFRRLIEIDKRELGGSDHAFIVNNF